MRRYAIEERYFRRPRRALVLGVTFLSIFVLLAVLVPAEPTAAEQHWQEWMHDMESPLLHHLALVLNYLGRGIGLALLFTAIGLSLLARKRWLALTAFAVAEALTAATSTIVKALIGRERPPDGLVHPASSSFPSGHTAFAGATSVALVLLFTAVGPRRRLWWSLALLATTAMAWSRTYLQVHWLLDVLAGALLGTGITLTVFSLTQPKTQNQSSPPVGS